MVLVAHNRLNFSRLLGLSLCIFVLSAGSGLSDAAEPGSSGAWLLAAGAEIDSGDSRAMFVGFDHAFGDRTWLQVGLEYVDAPSGLRDTQRLGIGLDYRFGKFGIVPLVEFWGDPDTFETWTLGGSGYFVDRGWRVSMNAGRRDIDITFQVPTSMDSTVEVHERLHSLSLGGSVRYGRDRWGIYASGTDFDYSRNLRISSPLVLLILSRLNASTISLRNSFLEYAAAAGFDYQLGTRSINLQYNVDKTVVGRIEGDTLSFGFINPISPRGDIELRLGYTRFDRFFDDVWFGGFTVYFYRSRAPEYWLPELD